MKKIDDTKAKDENEIEIEIEISYIRCCTCVSAWLQRKKWMQSMFV